MEKETMQLAKKAKEAKQKTTDESEKEATISHTKSEAERARAKLLESNAMPLKNSIVPLYNGIRDGVWKQVVNWALKIFGAQKQQSKRKTPKWFIIKVLNNQMDSNVDFM